jgi:hypothetical protein
MLAPAAPANNIADPANLGDHRAASEQVGIIYSGQAGFLDLGHIRETCDNTKHVYDQLVASGGRSNVNLFTLQGEAIITSSASIPASDWLSVAMDIAFDAGFGYEIFTYWIINGWRVFGVLRMCAGEHNSAFSPEDLCSNWLGTRLAGRAIAAGGNFNTAVTSELKKLITGLAGQTPAETRKAFNLINHCWVNFTGVTSPNDCDYLRRRNFTAIPWKTGHASDAPTPSWLTGGPSGTKPSPYYSYSHTLGRTIFDSDFPTEVSSIRTDAATRYGPNFDKPVPCP